MPNRPVAIATVPSPLPLIEGTNTMPFRTSLNRFAFAAFGIAALTGPMLAQPVLAASTCADATDMAAFRTAAVQQQLMVAALTCHDIDAYNHFVLAYQPELQKSDNDLKAYFIRRGSEAAYDTFKTKLANLSSLSDIANGPAYCANAGAAFDMALRSRQALSSFVADQRLMIALPQQTVCGEPKSSAPVLQAAASKAPPVRLAETRPEPAPARVRMAAAAPPRAMPVENVPGVPAYEMPASPYGDRDAPPPGYYRQDDARMAPPDIYRQDRDDADMAPPPPRPARPRLQQASRDDDFYAALYADQARRRYRWAPPPPPPDDYYYYER
jgi:hypothetical protein